jgi:hypothetical protein
MIVLSAKTQSNTEISQVGSVLIVAQRSKKKMLKFLQNSSVEMAFSDIV